MRGPARLAGLLLLVAPAPAHAAEVELRVRPNCQDSECKYTAGELVEIAYVAAPDETNSVTVTKQGGVVTLRETSAPMSAAPPCSIPQPGTVACPDDDPPRTYATTLRVVLGDGHDAASVTSDFGLGFAQVSGGPGDDRLHGGPGRDVMLPGSGRDTVETGLGRDTLSYADRSGPIRVDVPAGIAGWGLERDAFSGIDAVIGGSGADVLRGGPGDDILDGGPGDDRLDGAAGADQLTDGIGDDRLLGGPGEDRLTGIAGPIDEFGDEEVSGGEDRLAGGSGDDRLSDHSGSGELDGGPGDDEMAGTGRLTGGPGDDHLRGYGDPDVLAGGSGADRLEGAAGRDRYDGGPGDDRLLTRDGVREAVDCGAGRDSIDPDRADRRRACELRRQRR